MAQVDWPERIVDEDGKLTPDGQRVVAENRGLAYRMAQQVRVGRLDYEERLSIALEALIRAAIYFKPELGWKFSTYATWVIRREIGRAAYRERVISVGAAASRRGREAAILALGVVSIEDVACDPAEEPDDCDPEDAERIRRLVEAIGTLPPRLERVVRERLAGRTLQAIGDEMHITKERVRQLHGVAKAQLWRALTT